MCLCIKKKKTIKYTEHLHVIIFTNLIASLNFWKETKTLDRIEYSNSERQKREIEIWENFFEKEKDSADYVTNSVSIKLLTQAQAQAQTQFDHRITLNTTNQLPTDKKHFFALTQQRWKSKERHN